MNDDNAVEQQALDAVLRLSGYASTPAKIVALRRARSTRISRAALKLGIALVLLPIVSFIPPHFPWALAVLAIGPYLAWKEWRGDYVVRHFEGQCPNCASEMSIEAGTKLRLPAPLVCYACHQEPELQAARVPAPSVRAEAGAVA